MVQCLIYQDAEVNRNSSIALSNNPGLKKLCGLYLFRIGLDNGLMLSKTSKSKLVIILNIVIFPPLNYEVKFLFISSVKYYSMAGIVRTAKLSCNPSSDEIIIKEIMYSS